MSRSGKNIAIFSCFLNKNNLNLGLFAKYDKDFLEEYSPMEEGGVTFSDWARLKLNHEPFQPSTRMKKEQGVLTFTDWARLKRGKAAYHLTLLRKCSACRVEEDVDGANKDKVKPWSRLKRSSADDEETGEGKTKSWVLDPNKNIWKRSLIG